MSEGVSLFSTGAGTMAAQSSCGVCGVVALVLSLLALGGVILVLARQQRILGRYRQLMTGTSGGNLEQILNEYIGQMRETAARVETVGDLAHNLERDARFGLQHLGMVRFNPFLDTGGDQSFAIALADDHGNGLVLSSLHTRNATRIYAKPLQNWESGHSLTEEEKQAISQAAQSRG